MPHSMKSLEHSIRTDFESFAKKHDETIHSLIDWSQPIEFTSDRINQAILPDHMKCTEDQLNFLLTAQNHNGEKVIFSLLVKRNNEKSDIEVEFSEPKNYGDAVAEAEPKKREMDLDEEEELTEEQKQSLEEAREFFSHLKNLTAKIRASKEKKKPDSSRCNMCGRKDLTLNTVVDALSGEVRYICTPCYGRSRNKSPEKRTLSDVENEIEELEVMVKDLEEMINSQKMPDVPESMSNLAHTPVSLYKSMQAALADLKSEKMEMVSKMDTEKRINRELKEALAQEDYKKAEELKKRLKAMQKASNQKKK